MRRGFNGGHRDGSLKHFTATATNGQMVLVQRFELAGTCHWLELLEAFNGILPHIVLALWVFAVQGGVGASH